MLPGPSRGLEHAILGAWELNGVAIVQSGSALTIALTNATNVFGISEDRAQLTGTCAKNQLLTGGPTAASLTDSFNKPCFTTPPIIGADGKGTAFGDSGTGIVDGPGQANVDLSISKLLAFRWPHDGSSFQFWCQFFNAFNHPKFANPDANFSSPTFGVISRTAVNSRVGQFSLKFSFSGTSNLTNPVTATRTEGTETN